MSVRCSSCYRAHHLFGVCFSQSERSLAVSDTDINKMDKTTVFDATLYKRKPTDPTRYTDTFLCDEIHANLRTMSFLVPFNAELNAVFVHGMFMKPNAKAFPHVTRYLMIICDATEFRKTFRWPIYDKAGEALFRNSAMEAMNKLNAKYALGLDEIKNKILVFPGGMDFMRVIFEISRLCMQILIKRNATAPTDAPLTLGFVRQKTVNMEKLHDTVTNYSQELQTQISGVQAKTRLLQEVLDKCVASTSITSENILCDDFLSNWEHVQTDVIVNIIKPSVDRTLSLAKMCDQLVNQIHSSFDSEKVAYTTSDLCAFGVNMQSKQPQYYQQMSEIVTNGQLRMDRLLHAFRLAAPLMLRSIGMQRARSLDVLLYESRYMQELSLLVSSVLQKAFQLSVASETGCAERCMASDSLVRQSMVIDLKSLILSTPPVTYDASKRQTKSAIHTKRISLMDAAPVQMRSIPMLRPIAEQPSRAGGDADATLTAGSAFRAPATPTSAASEPTTSRLDPLRMLRNVHRTGLTGSPKRVRQTLQRSNDLSASVCSRSNETGISVPDFSSTLIGTHVNDKPYDLSNQINLSIAKALGSPVCAASAEFASPSGILSRMRHVQLDSTLRSGMTNISLSPSGRIEPLSMTTEANRDESILECTLTEENSFGTLNSGQAADNSGAQIAQVAGLDSRSEEQSNIGDIENDLNVSNRSRLHNLANLIDENDECLMNISDGILTDIDYCL